MEYKFYKGMEHSWFVYSLIIAYLIFYCVYKTDISIKQGAYIILAITFLYIILANKVFLLEWKLWASTLGFNLGMLLFIYEEKIKITFIKHKSTVLSIVLLLLLSIFFFSKARYGFAELSVCIGWPIITFVLVGVIGVPSNRFIDILAKYSYGYYLVHFTLFPFFRHWPIQGHFGNILFATFYFLISFILSVVITLLSDRLLHLLVNKGFK